MQRPQESQKSAGQKGTKETKVLGPGLALRVIFLAGFYAFAFA
jgi:hypothetical protein